MIKRYMTRLLALGFIAVVLAPDILNAQGLRPEQTFFIKPRVGIAWHLGDTEQSPGNLNLDGWKVDGKIPYAAGFELGYQFNQNVGLSLGWQLANLPLIYHYGDDVPAGAVEDEKTAFHSAQLLARFQTSGRIAPFVGIGGHYTFAPEDPAEATYGPAFALGLDVVLNDRMSLVLESVSNVTLPDEGIDGVEEPVGGEDFAPVDFLNTLTLGLKYNFKSAFTPVAIASLVCPTTPVTAGQPASFTANTNDDKATQPVEYRWDYGDGSTGTGLMSSHTFGQAGSYNVTFTASNARSTDTETCAVTVVPPPPVISALSGNPSTFEVCEATTVSFNATVGGGPADSYAWNFGDGSTGTGPNPTHVYNTEGTYTVTLTVTNVSGSDTRTMTVTAQKCTSICRDITELNSVYFERNASTLTDEGRAALQENIEILKECAEICVRLEGWAAPGERNGQRLSEDRARAVEQFYVDNGISGSRLMAVGMGVVQGQTSKKEGGNQLRRVDSIPMACDLMGSH